MKATGIVRRIDDLGRVVVPKEIRRTLRKDYLKEIFTNWGTGRFCKGICTESGTGFGLYGVYCRP